MIISRWKGFEIDSSEAYFYFQNEMEEVEDGFDFMRRLLTSPLVWHEVSFHLVPLEAHKKRMRKLLQDWISKGLVKEIEYEDYLVREVMDVIAGYDYHDMDARHLPSHIDPLYDTDVPTFLDIIDKLKNYVELISVNFCVAPLKSLPPDEYEKFRSWFIKQFDDTEAAESRWNDYCRISGDDLALEGISDDTSNWGELNAFDGSFEIFNKPPYSYRYILPGCDPSLTVYVLSELFERFVLRSGGPHGVTLDYSPDKLRLYKGYDPDDKEVYDWG